MAANVFDADANGSVVFGTYTNSEDIFITGASVFSTSGYANIYGSPVDNQVAIWKSPTHVEGDSDVTWNNSTFAVTGDISVHGDIEFQLDGDTTWEYGMYIQNEAETSKMYFGWYGADDTAIEYAFIGKSNSDTCAKFFPDGSAELYYNATQVFGTFSTGVNVGSGDLATGDLALRVNTDRPWSFWQEGADATATMNFSADSEGKNFYIRTYNDPRTSSHKLARFYGGSTGGYVELFYADDIKLATASSGVTVTGDINVSGNLDGTTGLNYMPLRDYPLYVSTQRFEITGDIGMYFVNAMAGNNAAPVAYHYKGTYNRLYFVIYDSYKDAGAVARAGHTTGTYIMYYDLDKGTLSAPVSITQQYTTATDYHDTPAMLVTDDGHIVIAKESLAPSGVHNSHLELWQSDSIEDISAFTKVLQVEHASGGVFAYPHLQKGPNSGEVFCFMRENGNPGGSVEPFLLSCIKSTDNGATWESLADVTGEWTTIAECEDVAGSGLNWYFYPYVTKGKERSYGLHLFGALNEGPTGTSVDGNPANNRQKFIIYMHSDDGVTWENVEEYLDGSGYTKNVVTGGEITAAQLLANFVIKDVSSESHESISVFDACVDSNGIPYILVSNSMSYDSTETPDYIGRANVMSGGNSGMFIMYYDTDTSAWIELEITALMKDARNASGADAANIPLHSSRSSFVAYGDGVIDYYVHRAKDDFDIYKPAYADLDDSANLVKGKVYRVTLTDPNTFGEGVDVDDYYMYGSVTLDASNTVVPVESEVAFWRTEDYGTTWFEIREPYVETADPYLQFNPVIATSSNFLDSEGYIGVFSGKGVKLDSSGTANDHSIFTMFVDKIKL